jgi:hypothetical protein
MGIRYKERDIITLFESGLARLSTSPMAYLDWFPPQNEERFRPLRKETGKLMNKNVLDLICLFDPYAYSHTVDAGLYEYLLILVSCDSQRIE